MQGLRRVTQLLLIGCRSLDCCAGVAVALVVEPAGASESHSTHATLNTSGPNSMVRLQCSVRYSNVNNLVYPTIDCDFCTACLAVQKTQSISCGLLSICSARNKIDGICSLMRESRLGVLSLCETRHEESRVYYDWSAA